ncbi:lysylphosphatidylglycerol synthase transmembrane domain-containing protein [Jatrophihabitans sp.]|uniref:lysylphosphatidylglycerol synthase transmembrane domain-containing protein n=1 Tax=Jatrophihabitans sp. TaxID=1932789 RepID=UPI0030C72A79|nr:hypothetical protein [Jatrophihabitans sp.]
MAEPDPPRDGPEPATLEVSDVASARIRRPLDLLRLIGLLLGLAVLAGLASVASATALAGNEDLARLLSGVPQILTRGLSLAGSLGVITVSAALVVREILRGRGWRLAEALLTGLVAIGIVDLLNLTISSDRSSSLHASLTDVARGTTGRPLDAYLAALFALALVIAVLGEPRWRSAFWTVVGVYVASAFLARQASLLTLIASPLIGAAAGVAARYLAGSGNDRPDARRVAEALEGRGIVLRSIVRVPRRHEQHREYQAVTSDELPLLVQVFDRDLVATGAVYRIYRRLRIRADVAAPPALSLERIAERRSLLALAAAAADVRTPRFVAGVPCGPDTIVLAYEQPEQAPFENPTDDQLDDLWANLTKLHEARMTHRGLTAERLSLDSEARVVLPIPTDGAVFASELRISLDRTQALITTAQVAGVERAVQAARSALSVDALAATVALLQPIALPTATRSALKEDSGLLESIRDEIRGQTDYEASEAIRVERFRPRTVVSIVAAVVAGYLLVAQLGSVDLVSVFAEARWRWVPLVLLASVGTYLAAALCLTGFVAERLPFARTVLVQIAASFVGFVAPPSVGGLAINIRYLRRSRLSPTAAATSVGISQISNAIFHAVLLIGFATATGVASPQSLPIPGWAFAALGVLALLLLMLLAIPAPRRWLLTRAIPPLREALPRLVDLLTSPVKLVEAVSGALLLNGCYIAALWFAVRAFGGGIDIAPVAVVYLAGAAVASVAPTPGGLGAVEIALSTGLAGAGMPSATAVSAVLLFRIATFWLPVPAGWVALHVLQRRSAV